MNKCSTSTVVAQSSRLEIKTQLQQLKIALVGATADKGIREGAQKTLPLLNTGDFFRATDVKSLPSDLLNLHNTSVQCVNDCSLKRVFHLIFFF